jgi:Lrp/AsnC family transcriptional regulator, regulator of ectoine-degradation genes
MVQLSLDDRDLAILSILSRDGRIAKAELARRVNLSPTPCWARLARLEAAGLIRGYRADIALAVLGDAQR